MIDTGMIEIDIQEYSTHKLHSLIPRDQKDRVYRSDMCDIDGEFMGFTGIYYALSLIIPKDFTVIDFGCAYNPQCYFFTEHKKFIAVNLKMGHEYFMVDNCELFEVPIEEWIKDHLKEVDQNKTFAICSYVPPWGTDNIKLVRENFKNVFTFYPG